MNRFLSKEVSIYYPYAEEIPYDLLEDAGADPERVANLSNEPFIRVAKHSGQVIGVYLLSQLDAQTFCLDALAVAPAFRNRGLGSWLVGHAIGVSESRGGRRVVVPRPYAGGLLARQGFAAQDPGQVLTITPE